MRIVIRQRHHHEALAEVQATTRGTHALGVIRLHRLLEQEWCTFVLIVTTTELGRAHGGVRTFLGGEDAEWIPAAFASWLDRCLGRIALDMLTGVDRVSHGCVSG